MKQAFSVNNQNVPGKNIFFSFSDLFIKTAVLNFNVYRTKDFK